MSRRSLKRCHNSCDVVRKPVPVGAPTNKPAERPAGRRVYSTPNPYTPEQWAWIAACAALQTRLGRRPTEAELLRLALSLGYRRGP